MFLHDDIRNKNMLLRRLSWRPLYLSIKKAPFSMIKYRKGL